MSTKDWVRLRPDKNGKLRGYERDIKKPIPRRRWHRLPTNPREMKRYGVPNTALSHKLETYMSVEDRINWLSTMPERKIRKRRKALLIKEWLEHGNPLDSQLLCIRMDQCGRNLI